jgi:hypothetical protein
VCWGRFRPLTLSLILGGEHHILLHEDTLAV